jgi:hypothetical protein
MHRVRLTLCLGASAGCSLLVVKRPPAVAPATGAVDCTTSGTPVYTDGIVGATGAAVALVGGAMALTADDSGCDESTGPCSGDFAETVGVPALIVGGVSAALFLGSAYYGAKATGRCKEMRRLAP